MPCSFMHEAALHTQFLSYQFNQEVMDGRVEVMGQS